MAKPHKPQRAPEICPVCAAEVPRSALACAECGADHNSGWREDADLGGLAGSNLNARDLMNFSSSSPSPHVSRGLVVLGRAGLAARGIVYLTVGTLAALAGLGRGGGKVVDQGEAVRTLGGSSLGEILLWIIGVGLASYVLWRFGQVLLARGREFDGSKGLLKRAIALVSGLAYAGLSITAFTQALGRSSGGKGGSAQQDGAEWLISQPLGRWLVAAVGVVIVAAAVAQFGRAYTASFTEHLRGGGLTHEQEEWTRSAGRAGFAARGVSFALIGWFFLQAALQDDASEAGGLGAALQTLATQPAGSILLAVVGAGLALFGAYSLVEARYRRIE